MTNIYVQQKGQIDGARLVVNTVSTVDIGVGTVRDSTDEHFIDILSTLTANIAVVGANGRDAGLETADTLYALFVIDDSSGGTQTPSTIVDITGDTPKIVRAGAHSPEQLAELLGQSPTR